MSNRKLAVLGLAAVVMLVWAVVQTKIADRQVEPTDAISTPLIQGLDPAKVMQVVIGTGDNTVTLKRVDKGFFVADKNNYPAMARRINELFTGLLDIKTRQRITSNRQNHIELEVTEAQAQKLVKFLDAESRLITGIIVGKRAESGDSYVRRISADDVYLAGNVPRIRNSAMDYINQQLLELKRDALIRVTVAEPNGTYTLKPDPNSTDVIFAGKIPQGKKLKDNSEQVFSALANLRFDDVFKPASASDDLNFNRTYICHLKDSTVYTLSIAKNNDKTFVECKAEFTDTEKVVKGQKVESEEQLKKKETKLLARDAVKKFNEAHAGWLYEIAKPKADNLTMALNDLFEDEKEPEPSQL